MTTSKQAMPGRRVGSMSTKGSMRRFAYIVRRRGAVQGRCQQGVPWGQGFLIATDGCHDLAKERPNGKLLCCVCFYPGGWVSENTSATLADSVPCAWVSLLLKIGQKNQPPPPRGWFQKEEPKRAYRHLDLEGGQIRVQVVGRHEPLEAGAIGHRPPCHLGLKSCATRTRGRRGSEAAWVIHLV